MLRNIRWISAFVFVLAISGWVSAQERETREGAGRESGVVDKARLAVTVEQLKRSVNGKAFVRNQCRSRGQQVDIEESTELTELDGCHATFLTRKSSHFTSGQRDVQFKIHVDLADLTTPTSVAEQTFAQCSAEGGGKILKIISLAQPGKKLRTTRTASSQTGAETTKEPETELTRNDLSLFFSDPVAAKRTAKLLDRAIEICGGADWPDDDDLP